MWFFQIVVLNTVAKGNGGYEMKRSLSHGPGADGN
jgi:hypothetical protein